MVLLRYLLMVTGTGLLTAAAAILAWDLYKILRASKLPGVPGEPAPPDQAPLLGPAGSLAAAIHLALARQLALPGFGLLLAGLSIAVVPSGSAGVRVNQFVGTRPKTLYPGVHFVIPLIESLETYNLKNRVFTTSIPEGLPNAKDDARVRGESLRVQTRARACLLISRLRLATTSTLPSWPISTPTCLSRSKNS